MGFFFFFFLAFLVFFNLLLLTLPVGVSLTPGDFFSTLVIRGVGAALSAVTDGRPEPPSL